MATAQDVFELAMGLIDELRAPDGAADWPGVREYKARAVPILNVLRHEVWAISDTWFPGGTGVRSVCPEIEDLNSEIELDDAICEGALPYGLAYHLLYEENPDAAGMFYSRYRQVLKSLEGGGRAVSEDIVRLYGGDEYSDFGRWS